MWEGPSEVRVIERMRNRPGEDAPTDETVEIDAGPIEPGADDVSPPGPLTSLWARVSHPRSPVVIYAGLAAIAAGFGLAVYTWGRVAGLIEVPLQLPYIASGGLTAIGLVVVGAWLVAAGTARRDAARLESRFEELAGVMRAIREALEAKRR